MGRGRSVGWKNPSLSCVGSHNHACLRHSRDRNTSAYVAIHDAFARCDAAIESCRGRGLAGAGIAPHSSTGIRAPSSSKVLAIIGRRPGNRTIGTGQPEVIAGKLGRSLRIPTRTPTPFLHGTKTKWVTLDLTRGDSRCHRPSRPTVPADDCWYA